jgi:flagellar biosynthesis protein FlhG
VPDQAAELRALVAARAPAARVVAVTSGKGGVGKTSVAVNLAVAAGRLGRRVVLADLDLGLANADVLLGVRPASTLAHVLAGRSDVLAALAPAHGIQLLAGASGLESVANLTSAGRDRLLAEFERLDRRADLVVLDTGAGASRNVVEFAAAADEILLVTTPEPTALVDAYATAKLIGREPGRGALRLVVNLAADRAEAERVSAGLCAVSRKHLGLDLDRLGYILRDDAVGRACRARTPVVVLEPASRAGQCLANLAGRLVGEGSAEGGRGWWRAILGLRKGA